MNKKNGLGLVLVCVLGLVLAACQQTTPRDTPSTPTPSLELVLTTKSSSGGSYPSTISWRDNQTVYLGGYGFAELWTPATNARQPYVSKVSYSNYGAVWSPDKRRLLSGRYIWNDNAPTSADFDPTPTNAIVLAATEDANVAKDWKPDGTEVVLGIDCYHAPSDDPFVIYSATTGQKIRTLIARTSYWGWFCGAEASWISNSRIILGQRLVDAVSGDILNTLQPRLGRSAYRYAVSPNKQHIAQIAYDSTTSTQYLEWYSTADFSFENDMVIPSDTVNIQWLPDNLGIAVVGRNGNLTVYNTTTADITVQIRLHNSEFYQFDFSPDQTQLISYWNNGFYVWDTTLLENPASWELVQFSGVVSEKHNANVYDLALQNAKTLVSTGRDGFSLWLNAKFGLLRQRDKLSSQAIYALQFSSDGTTYATAGEDSTIHLWNSTTRKEIGTLVGHTYTIRSLAWKPNSTTLASAGWDDTVRIWNTQTQTLEQTQTDHTNYVNVVKYNPSGTQLASASSDGTIKLRHPDTGATQHTLKPQDSSSPVFSIAYSPDGMQLVSGSEDHQVRIWNPATQTLTATLKGHLGAVRAVAWLNATTLVTGGMDGRIIVWDVPNQKLLLEVKPDLGAVFALTTAPDGKTFYAGFDSGNLAAWKVTP